jgi:hypothetical protein
MTTKSELAAKKRHRYMLRGAVGSGKTHSLIMLAKRYLTEGKQVLFVDFKDVGATEELEKLDSELLDLLDYETPASYSDLVSMKMLENVKLIIIDALHHLRFTARKHIRDQFINQGHYTTGGKEIKIEDIDTFDLGILGYGAGYSAANIRENDIIDMLMNSGKDIAVSVIPDPISDRPTFTDILMANFDNILDLSFKDNEDGKREWLYKVYRWRGIESNNYSAQPNDGDPFGVVEKTGGKPTKEYMIRFTLKGEQKKEFVTAINPKDAEAILKAMYEKAENIEVVI